jgi:hypothetical protein
LITDTCAEPGPVSADKKESVINFLHLNIVDLKKILFCAVPLRFLNNFTSSRYHSGLPYRYGYTENTNHRHKTNLQEPSQPVRYRVTAKIYFAADLGYFSFLLPTIASHLQAL